MTDAITFKLSSRIPSSHYAPSSFNLQSILEPILRSLQLKLASLSLLIIPHKLDAKQHNHNNNKSVRTNSNIKSILIIWGVLCSEDGRSDNTAYTTSAHDCGGCEGTFLWRKYVSCQMKRKEIRNVRDAKGKVSGLTHWPRMLLAW